MIAIASSQLQKSFFISSDYSSGFHKVDLSLFPENLIYLAFGTLFSLVYNISEHEQPIQPAFA